MIYSKLKAKEITKTRRRLKPYHHVWSDKEFVSDCEMWKWFLSKLDVQGMCRPFVDFTKGVSVKTSSFHSDASKNPNLGFGAVYRHRWLFGKWNPDFIREEDPSIEFLELYALTVAMIQWGGVAELQHTRVAIYCDNEAVIHMVNKMTSSCA